jgi:membrane-associated phospholipid phosphatase
MVAVQFTIEVELMFKHAFACYRPVDFSPQVQPIITTPGHGTYPMGHAAQAFATIVALSGLLGILPAPAPAPPHPAYTQLRLQARRFSVNRIVAGVHFPIDAAAGQVLGTSLGEFFLCMCGLANLCHQRTFAPALAGDNVKNNYLGDDPNDPNGAAAPVPLPAITPSPYLVELTALANKEWS